MFRTGMFPEEHTGAEASWLVAPNGTKKSGKGPPSSAPGGSGDKTLGPFSVACVPPLSTTDRLTTNKVRMPAADWSAAAEDNIQELTDLARKVY